MCIGNRDGGDDAIGPYIADELKKEIQSDMVLDCETTPENYTGFVKQKKPKLVILIDAAEMDLPAGTIRIIPKEKIGCMHISTHGIPLSILISYLEREVQHVLLIGIQPQQMVGPLSPVTKKNADQLITILKKHQYDQIPHL
ncbi:MAG: hydrogenase 3 maturation endopeptidase HyCI [Candidatus Thermoplasmatota archaeon]|nr:hydrogenase 3 maturation endopeptidase HyCI [Candidatus Thermoplasmatota archaeon]